MQAMVFHGVGTKLRLENIPIPEPGPHEVLIRVSACALCRTDLHIIDGELKNPLLPLIPGHQVVGRVEACGAHVKNCAIGQRVGVSWLGSSCGLCTYCLHGQENLCDDVRYTGYQLNGGFAEYCVADSRFCFLLPHYPDTQAAPLLCAGIIGLRAMSKTDDSEHIGFYGFGSSAHILVQIARYQKKQVYAFVKKGDLEGEAFAKSLGACWAGNSEQQLSSLLDAAIIFAPDGSLIPRALANVKKGGKVICAGIHMSDIPSFSYDLLWGERSLHSVANLTRKDADNLLNIAPLIPIKTHVNIYPLNKANEALEDLKYGRFFGASVLKIGGETKVF